MDTNDLSEEEQDLLGHAIIGAIESLAHAIEFEPEQEEVEIGMFMAGQALAYKELLTKLLPDWKEPEYGARE